MKREWITIRLLDKQLRVYALTEDGLGIHKSPDKDNGWSVTHIQSGRVLHPNTFKLKKQAISFLHLVKKLTDWTADVETIESAMKDRRDVILKAIEIAGSGVL